MKIPKKDVLLLIGLLGILAMVCSYFLVYQPVMEKADVLERENRELQARINDLTIKMEDRDSYLEDTAAMKRDTAAIYQRFPVDVREEDGILFAVNQEAVSSMLISSIHIDACEPVVTAGFQEEASGGEHVADETNQEEMPSVLMKRNVTINYLVSYDGLKRSIENICSQDDRMSINNLTVSYDESTGLLTGMTSVDLYCIPGQPDKEYVQPDFSSVLLGTDDIFGSIAYDAGEEIEDIYVEEEEAGLQEDTEE